MFSHVFEALASRLTVTMKPSLTLFAVTILFVFVNPCQSRHFDFFQIHKYSNISKYNFYSNLVLAMGPDMVIQYLLGNYTQSLPYRLDVVDDLTNALRTLKPRNASVCVDDIYSAFEALFRLDYWGIQIYDAQGKIRSSVTDGNIIWPGSYKICRKIVQGPPYSPQHPEPFRGKYCWADVDFNINWVQLPVANITIPLLRWGLCVPNTCSPDEVLDFLSTITDFDVMKRIFRVTDITCLPEKSDFWTDKNVVLALFIGSIFAMVISLATAIDVYLEYFIIIRNRRVWWKFSLSFRSDATKNRSMIFTTKYNSNKSQQDKRNTRSIPNGVFSIEAQKPLAVKEEGLMMKAILSFSLYRNALKLLEFEKPKLHLGCINGIRVLTMWWIILNQSSIVGALMSDNLLTVVEQLLLIVFEMLTNIGFATTTFFFLSGFLVSYTYLVNCEENNGKTSWVKFYLYRYIRLTPVYLCFIVLFDNSLVNYISEGPFWPSNGFEGNNCNKNWWLNMLYLNNFLPAKYACLEQSWFLATDMQFYVLSPLILILLSQYFPIGVMFSGIFILISWLTSGFVSFHYNIKADINYMELFPKTEPYYEVLDNFYIKHYLHIAPYVIGILFGWILQRRKFEKRLKIWMVCLGWTFSTGAGLCLIFGLYKANEYISLPIASIYHTFSRTLWSLMLCWVIFACTFGYGGIVNAFLSFPMWRPLSRLTYCAFLIHILVINVTYDRADIPTHFNYVHMVYYAIANIFVVYVFSVPLFLVFEMPFLELLKLNPKSRAG